MVLGYPNFEGTDYQEYFLIVRSDILIEQSKQDIRRNYKDQYSIEDACALTEELLFTPFDEKRLAEFDINLLARRELRNIYHYIKNKNYFAYGFAPINEKTELWLQLKDSHRYFKETLVNLK